MFTADFFPTPANIIEQMLNGFDLTGKTVLEPSAGKGNIVDFCIGSGASVIACEKNEDLQKILQTKCRVIADDFLTVTSEQVSHVDFIVMNPPFSADEKHILHAYEIAPAGCQIIALCNLNTIENRYSSQRKELHSILEAYGSWANLGQAFSTAERKTGVEIALLRLKKPGENYASEFDGFFMEADPEEEQANGLMSYNFVRDLVNRYVAAIKVFDRQLLAAVEMNALTKSFFTSSLAFSVTEGDAPKSRQEFKKDLQKAAWKFVFSKMNMEKHATKGLKQDINKFVEQQQKIPFTMRNIYKMIEIVIGTTSQRMDRAVIEVFDKLTQHHAENRQGLEGWKTNSHYVLNKKFIHPHLFTTGWSGGLSVTHSSDHYETIDDLNKTLCYITGENYEAIGSFWNFNHIESAESLKAMEEGKASGKYYYHTPEYEKHEFNKWYDFGFFRLKGFKKGTAHLEFKDDEVLAKFNQRVGKLKGYPLFEGKTQTAYQDRQTGRAKQEKKNPAHAYKPTVLFEIKTAC